MQTRYALRFETGERRGETVQVPQSGLTVGRRPGNSIQILDASVSGRHAELSVDDRGVLLRDLGSTNGTRVGGERISERYLAHGDDVLFGNIHLTFVDGKLAEPAAVPEATATLPSTAAAASAGAAGEGVRTISAERVARSGARSKAALVGLVLLAAGAGGAFYALRGGAGASEVGGSTALRPVELPAGELLAADYSFENPTLAWSSAEEAPAGFVATQRAAYSGRSGMQSDLQPGEWALELSPAVSAPRGRALRVSGQVRTTGAAEALLGLELVSSTGAVEPVRAWSQPLRAADFAELQLAFEIPPIYDQARALILARCAAGAGEELARAEVDDVSLTPAEGAGAPLRVDEYQLYLCGNPAGSALLFKIDRVLISDLRVAGPGPAMLAPRAPLQGEVRPEGVQLGAQMDGGSLELRVEPALAAQGVATLAPAAPAGAEGDGGGHRVHQTEFERNGVTRLLLGAGRDLVSLQFPAPARVSGRPEREGFALSVELGGREGFFLQLAFRAEREQAFNLGRTAADAQRTGDLGRALELYGRLLDEFPFETAEVERATRSRSELVLQGLTQVQELRVEMERARFFRLVDLYRQLRARAQALSERYKPSEVQRAADELTAELDADLALLEADLDRREVERLRAIAAALEAGGNSSLAGRVRTYLEERFKEPRGGP